MKRMVLLFGIAMCFQVFAWEDGPGLLESQKCLRCHEVTALNIKTTSDKEPEKVHDLSKAGADFASGDEIKAFLLREAEFNGKKHKSKFKGTDEELQTLVDWLLEQK